MPRAQWDNSRIGICGTFKNYVICVDSTSTCPTNNKDRKYYLNNQSNIDYINYGYNFEQVEELSQSPYQHYLTEELAEQAKKLKDFNDKLLAFKYCYDRDYKPDFSGDYDYHTYYVYYDSEDGKYDYDWGSANNMNIVYFSSPEVAQKCADWLNSLGE